MKSANDLSMENDSRQKLIAAGTELFSSKGFHAVSVREICDKAQVNVSLISYYFTGKEGLLGAVMEELTKGSAQKVESLLQRFDSKEEFEERLTNFLNGIVQFYLDNSSLMRLFLDELEKGQSEAEKVFGETFFKTFEVLKRFLRKGIDAGHFRTTTQNETILLIQVVGPVLNLMRAEACTLKFYKTSLSDEKFRQELIEQIVKSVIAS